MLKKGLKCIGIAGAVYAVVQVLYLAFIGAGRTLEKARNTENLKASCIIDDVFDEAVDSWKWYIGLFKN